MIDSFSGEYFYLSNFSTEGATLPTVEHQFQARKTLVVEEAIAIMAATTPGEAKKLGRRVSLRPDWEDIKLDVMWELLWNKFALDLDLSARLVATADEELVEGNNWGDTYWGVCRGKGENHLGILLMDVRSELQEHLAGRAASERDHKA